MLSATAMSSPAPECQGITVDSYVLAALERDFGLSTEQACDRLIAEKEANRTYRELREALGGAFAGAWFDAEALQLVVATVNANAIDLVQATGAQAKLVVRSLKQLEAVKGQLDTSASFNGVSPLIWSWYIDVKANEIVVVIEPGNPEALDAAMDFIAKSGADADAVRIEELTTERPQLFYDVRGGDAFYNDTRSWRCSVGFSVSKGTDNGYATAGHCGTTGDSVSGYNSVPQGQFAGSQFPGDDMAWASVNSNWTVTSTVCVNDQPVNGSQEAAVGTSVYRCGSTTTGPHSGEILAKNETVIYPQGPVYGLTKTDACAEPGDSGGPFMYSDQAQGVTSGGSGNCTQGGITYFQPLSPLLSTFGLSLFTSTAYLPAPSLDVYPFGCWGYHSVVWTAVNGATNYKLYKSPYSNFNNPSVIYDGSNTNTVVNVPTNTTWYLRVKACDANGCSDYSNQRSATWINGCY